MPKADTNHTTNHPDATLFKNIERVKELWSQLPAADRAQRTARILGNLPEEKALEARQDQIIDEACALEWKIAYTETATLEGHAAKCDMIAASEFDAEDLVAIAWHLGHEASKLGLSDAMPSLTPPVVPPVAEAA